VKNGVKIKSLNSRKLSKYTGVQGSFLEKRVVVKGLSGKINSFIINQHSIDIVQLIVLVLQWTLLLLIVYILTWPYGTSEIVYVFAKAPITCIFKKIFHE